MPATAKAGSTPAPAILAVLFCVLWATAGLFLASLVSAKGAASAASTASTPKCPITSAGSRGWSISTAAFDPLLCLLLLLNLLHVVVLFHVVVCRQSIE